MLLSKEYPSFVTTTCLEWKPILKNNDHKDILIDSMRFLVTNQRVVIYGFVIMDNHFHLIWQLMGDNRQQFVQRDFLKFTGQHILYNLQKINQDFLGELYVGAKDRKYQVWERNSLNVPLWSEGVFLQKLEYIHNNPVRAGICEYPEEYEYSSAGFYICNSPRWDFLSHYEG